MPRRSVERRHRLFTWNAAGKLSTTVKNAKTHTYKTNALDQRISKNGPLSSKFFFFYDPAGQLIGEYRDNASTATPTNDWLVRQETIWLENIPVAVIKQVARISLRHPGIDLIQTVEA